MSWRSKCLPASIDSAKWNVATAFWWCLFIFLTVMFVPLFILGLVFGLVAKSHAEANDLLVDLGYAKYNGFEAKNGTNAWWGIRYAAPPVGNLRFRAPQEPAIDTALQQADAHGPICHSSPSTSLSSTKKEDCLFLDVLAPAYDNKTHPVFIWFQGGGFNDLADPNRDGTSLIQAADKDLVVVTFNYRVGLYGFLASKEVKGDGDLNAGLLDQRKVLHWVQKYIQLFGGDPDRVTIGGGSAGGASVDLHLTAYGGRDEHLFHAAAAESASYGVQLTVEESQYQYDALIKRVKCDTTSDTLKCLRDLDVKVLAQNNPNIPTPGGGGGTPVFMWSNTIDGTFTQNWTYNLYEAGKFVKVPVIFGSTTNDGSIFTPKNLSTAGEMNSFLKNNFPKLTSEDLATTDSFYPAPPTPQFPDSGRYWRPASDAYGDMRYTCPGVFMSGVFPRVGGVNASWNYHWDVLRPENAANGLGVTHVSESPAIWGIASQPEKALQPILQAYWASFIRSGNPNTYKLPTAPEWIENYEGDSAKGANQRIHFVNDPTKVAMETIDTAQKDRCNFWNSIGPKIGQ